MPAERKNGYLEPPRTRRQMRALYNRVIRKAAAMSTEERFETLVRAGIYTKSGKLTKPYRAAAAA